MPSQLIDDVMSGKTKLTDQSGPIQSACSLYIYQDAYKILKLPTKEERRLVLDRVPELLRPHIEEEVKRLWLIGRK